MLALHESTEFSCVFWFFFSNIYLCWRRERFKMSLSELALDDALVFLLASSATEWLLAPHFPHVFPAASSTDKMLNENTRKNFHFIPRLHHLCLGK